MEFDILETKNPEIKFVHSQKIIKLIRKAKYIRILDPNCKSPKDKDCYKACLQQYPPLYEMTSSDEKTSFESIPSNWRLDEENNVLIYEANLHVNNQVINLETGQEVILSKWTIVDCF